MVGSEWLFQQGERPAVAEIPANNQLPISSVKPARPARRRSLHDELVESLRQMILEGELPPGIRVPEGDICAQFEVSRTPLREALKVLASEGLIVLLPNRGSMVSMVRVDEIADAFEVLAPLEELIGRLVIRRASDEQIQEIEAMHRDMCACHRADHRAQYFRLNQMIHNRLAQLAGNEVLEATYEALSRKIMRARSVANADRLRWTESVQEHEAFMQALKARDGRRFSKCLRQHSERTGEAVVNRLSEQKGGGVRAG